MDDTIVAIATPPGRGGVGVIRLSGADAPAIAKQLLHQESKPQELKVREAKLCAFLGEDGVLIDSGILIYYPQPASYTGEHVVEFQGHGGRVVMSMLLDRLITLGARQARPGEFTERAFLNNKIDLIQAEAVADLIDSVSSQAARSAARSLDGEFSNHINALLQQLISLRMSVESMLDFPEEAIDFIQSAALKEKLSACVVAVDKITKCAQQGVLLGEGLQMVIMGRPNVGKSSLLNQLAGREAAIVSATPGTTRDIIAENILIEGVPLYIIDTAGLRETENEIEAEGVRRALKAASQADIVLLVLECAQSIGVKEQAMLDTLSKKAKIILIRNKIDLLENKSALLDKNNDLAEVYLSVKTGEGMQSLIQRLKTVVGLSDTAEGVCMARIRHLHALFEAKEFLGKGVQQMENKNTPELLAEDLRLAQESLGSITGSFIADDLLGEIFSNFCIGK